MIMFKRSPYTPFGATRRRRTESIAEAEAKIAEENREQRYANNPKDFYSDPSSESEEEKERLPKIYSKHEYWARASQSKIAAYHKLPGPFYYKERQNKTLRKIPIFNRIQTSIFQDINPFPYNEDKKKSEEINDEFNKTIHMFRPYVPKFNSLKGLALISIVSDWEKYLKSDTHKDYLLTTLSVNDRCSLLIYLIKYGRIYLKRRLSSSDFKLVLFGKNPDTSICNLITQLDFSHADMLTFNMKKFEFFLRRKAKKKDIALKIKNKRNSNCNTLSESKDSIEFEKNVKFSSIYEMGFFPNVSYMDLSFPIIEYEHLIVVIWDDLTHLVKRFPSLNYLSLQSWPQFFLPYGVRPKEKWEKEIEDANKPITINGIEVSSFAQLEENNENDELFKNDYFGDDISRFPNYFDYLANGTPNLQMLDVSNCDWVFDFFVWDTFHEIFGDLWSNVEYLRISLPKHYSQRRIDRFAHLLNSSRNCILPRLKIINVPMK